MPVLLVYIADWNRRARAQGTCALTTGMVASARPQWGHAIGPFSSASYRAASACRIPEPHAVRREQGMSAAAYHASAPAPVGSRCYEP